jgi:hypothetical protein
MKVGSPSQINHFGHRQRLDASLVLSKGQVANLQVTFLAKMKRIYHT